MSQPLLFFSFLSKETQNFLKKEEVLKKTNQNEKESIDAQTVIDFIYETFDTEKKGISSVIDELRGYVFQSL